MSSHFHGLQQPSLLCNFSHLSSRSQQRTSKHGLATRPQAPTKPHAHSQHVIGTARQADPAHGGIARLRPRRHASACSHGDGAFPVL